MKKLYFLLILIFLPLFLSYFPAFTILEKIETDHFIIYYEKNLGEFLNPEYLKFMEDSYSFLRDLFNNDIKYKVYVYLSSREKIANGFDSPIGRSTIYIITTPPEITSSIGYMDQWFKLVFYHELTHQFTLTIKNKLSEFLSYLFGNIFLPSYFNNPFYMVEGVTTSLEGRDLELGRAYSPAVKEYIMQSIIDGNFKSPYELESGYDEYPYHSAGYWYGAFFSKFLQQTYSMEFYTKLWQLTGSIPFEMAVKKVYEKELIELWEEFYDWVKPNFEPYVNFESCLKNTENKQIFTNGKIAKIKDKTYYFYYNETFETIFKYDIELKKNEEVIKNISSFYSFEIDQNKNLLLLQFLDLKAGNYVIKNKIFNLENNKFEKSIVENFDYIREISFFNDSFIGIDLSRSFTDLVMINQDGSKQLLISGNKLFYISNPAQLDLNKIVFLGIIDGKRNLFLYDILKKTITRLEVNAKFIYGFNIYDNKIYFVYNDDYTLSKFGMIDGDLEIHLEKNYSGGFKDPYYLDGKIYYIGSFSDKSLLLKLSIDIQSSILTQNQTQKEFKVGDLVIYQLKDENYKLINLNEIFKSNDKDTDNQNSNNQDNNNKDTNNQNTDNQNTDIQDNNNKDTEDIEYKKSTILYPFNENLLPDFWLPTISFYFESFEDKYNFYLNGYGFNIIWLDNISESFSSAGFYLSSLEPLKISCDFISQLNYFKPFTVDIFIASYWMDDINLLDDSLQYAFISNIDIHYNYWQILSNKFHYFNLGFFYKFSQNKFLSIYFDYQFFSNLFNLNLIQFNLNNLFYISKINFTEDYNLKYELEISIFSKIFNIELKDNFAISKDFNLTCYPVNEYFHKSLYEPIYEINFSNPDINFNFFNEVKLEATIFETKNMGVLNIFLSSSTWTLGLYLGYKYYFISNLDFKNLNFTNNISNQFIYTKISFIFTEKLIDLGFTASYSIDLNKTYYYLYYTIKI